jgi:hypothetical protein
MIEDAKILPNMSKEKMTELGYGLTHEEFINECQTNDDFANRWGCKIVIKELSHQERSDLKNSPPYEYGKPANGKLIDKRLLDSCNVPTKLITVIYTEKIESYV